MTGERGDRAHDRAEIARVGDVVERHQQCGTDVVERRGEQIVGVRVRVRRHLKRHALMQSVRADAVEIMARNLKDRDAAVSRQRDRLGQPFVGFGTQSDVQR